MSHFTDRLAEILRQRRVTGRRNRWLPAKVQRRMRASAAKRGRA